MIPTGILLHQETAYAHCDTLDGPVVKAAQKALQTKDIKPVLIWVGKNDEPEIEQAFLKTLKIRTQNPEVKELADRYFFETLVRIHRAGESAPYQGLRPAGTDAGPVIPLADRALETGSPDALMKLLTETVRQEILKHYKDAMAKKKFNPSDIAAGREYVKAYGDYVHFVESIFESAKGGNTPVHSGEGYVSHR
jgi:hypothetical protein